MSNFHNFYEWHSYYESSINKIPQKKISTGEGFFTFYGMIVYKLLSLDNLLVLEFLFLWPLQKNF